jgi:hypothetical protein
MVRSDGREVDSVRTEGVSLFKKRLSSDSIEGGWLGRKDLLQVNGPPRRHSECVDLSSFLACYPGHRVCTPGTPDCDHPAGVFATDTSRDEPIQTSGARPL